MFATLFKSTRGIRNVHVNKYSLSFFKSYHKIKEAELLFASENRFVIHPFSYIGIFHEVVMLIITIVYAFIMPYYWTFCPNEPADVFLNIFFDVIFASNIVLSFFTGYIDGFNHIVITNLKLIAINYMKHWFIIDFIGIFPINYILENINQYYGITIIKSLRILNIFKIFRITKLIKYRTYIHEVDILVKNQISFLHIGLWIFIILHYLGCFQYFIPDINGTVAAYFMNNERILNGSCFEKYTWSLHYSTSQVLSTGYGVQLSFPTNSEGWLVCLTMLIGHMILGILASAMVVYFSFNNGSDVYSYKKMEEVQNFINYYQLPSDISSKLLEHFYKNINQLYSFQKLALENELPHSQKIKLRMLRLGRSLKESIMLKEFPLTLLYHLCKLSIHSSERNKEYLLKDSIFNAAKILFVYHGDVILTNTQRSFQFTYSSLDFLNSFISENDEGYDRLIIKFYGNCEIFYWKNDSFNYILPNYSFFSHFLDGIIFKK